MLFRWLSRIGSIATLCLAMSSASSAEYRLDDYRANGYRTPPSKLDLWQINHGAVEARVEHLIAFFSRSDQIFSTRSVAPGEAPLLLREAPREFPPVRFSVGPRLSLEQWMAKHPVTGMLVMQGNTILFERYQYDRAAADRFLGMSMSKSVIGMLVGIALEEKLIASLDDTAQTYEPRLRGHPYGETTIRSLLTMTSGMAYQEARDSGELWRRTAGQSLPSPGLESVKFVRNRSAPQGRQFNYNSADTQVLGLVLMAATGKNLSEYTSEKLWKLLGAERSAYWLTDAQGREAAFAGFAATLRDWGRLGLMWANGGLSEGKTVLPSRFLSEASAWRSSGYGFHVWLPARNHPQVAFLGVRGQTLFVDPSSKLVMVITAVREQEISAGSAYDEERRAIWEHLRATLGSR